MVQQLNMSGKTHKKILSTLSNLFLSTTGVTELVRKVQVPSNIADNVQISKGCVS